MSAPLPSRLTTRLNEPVPPPTLKASVMARVAREAARAEAPTRALAPVGWRAEAPAWLGTTLGFTLVAGTAVFRWMSSGATPAPTVVPIAPSALGFIPPDTTGAVVLGLGLLAYLGGLFSPLRGRGRR